MRAALLLILLAVACTPIPPAPPVPRTAMPVAASFGRTWEAVIDAFAEKNIAIRNLDRASGFVAAEDSRVTLGYKAVALADCGRDILGTEMIPSTAAYNIIVRGDSTQATVKATVRFVTAAAAGVPGDECSSKGVWEAEVEQAIKARAEKPR